MFYIKKIKLSEQKIDLLHYDGRVYHNRKTKEWHFPSAFDSPDDSIFLKPKEKKKFCIGFNTYLVDSAFIEIKYKLLEKTKKSLLKKILFTTNNQNDSISVTIEKN